MAGDLDFLPVITEKSKELLVAGIRGNPYSKRRLGFRVKRFGTRVAGPGF